MDDKPYIMLGHGRAYSNREHVNIILSHESNRDGNHYFPRARGKVHDYIKETIEWLIVEIRSNGETLWPAYAHPRITVRSEPGVPGEYHWTAWDE